MFLSPFLFFSGRGILSADPSARHFFAALKLVHFKGSTLKIDRLPERV